MARRYRRRSGQRAVQNGTTERHISPWHTLQPSSIAFIAVHAYWWCPLSPASPTIATWPCLLPLFPSFRCSFSQYYDTFSFSCSFSVSSSSPYPYQSPPPTPSKYDFHVLISSPLLPPSAVYSFTAYFFSSSDTLSLKKKKNINTWPSTLFFPALPHVLSTLTPSGRLSKIRLSLRWVYDSQINQQTGGEQDRRTDQAVVHGAERVKGTEYERIIILASLASN